MEQRDHRGIATAPLKIAYILLPEARQFSQALLPDGLALANPFEISANKTPHVHRDKLADYTLEGLSSLRVFSLRPMANSALQIRPPDEAHVTSYDELHLSDYLRLLDAEADGSDWREAARLILGLDPDLDFETARAIYNSHLARARWMTEVGYAYLLGPQS